MKCTWVQCENEAEVPQIGKDGLTWANLCKNHDKELTASFERDHFKKVISNWIKAKGGSKKAAEAMSIPVRKEGEK